MPSKLPWSKSNRSHHSIDTSSGHVSPVPSANPSVNEPPRYTSDAAHHLHLQQQHPQQQQQQQQHQQISPAAAQGAFQPPQFPERTTSHRHSAHVTLNQQNLQQLQAASGPTYDQPPRRGSLQPQSPYIQEPPAPKQKQSLRSRLGLTSHKEEEGPKASKTEKLGRRGSVRKDNLRDHQAHPQDQTRLRASPWNNSRHGASNPHLPTATEQDESQHVDPFLQQQEDNPQVPPKDAPFQAQYPQNPPQDQYRPPLARVNTDGTAASYHTQSGVDQHSHYNSPEQQQQQQPLAHSQQQPPQPPQHNNPQLSPNQPPQLQQQQTQQHSPSPPQHPNQQQPQQQQQYQSYHPASAPPPQSSGPGEYKAFHLPNQPSPLAAANTQLHPPEHPAQQQQQQTQQQSYYQYQAQQQAQQPPSQQTSHDSHPENIHYNNNNIPPPHFSPPVQPHHSQDFPHSHHVRGSSQGNVELNTPASVDTQHSQQLRPPSSQGHIAPPSPLQPSPLHPSAVTFPAHDSQQGQQSHNPDPHSQSTTPPHQTQDNMAPTAQRNTLRKVNEGGQPAAGPPSRESSLLSSQASTQGQALGQPPLSPGLHQTFGANVVPTASQGQPYRGDKQGQPASGAELGRATPPPRSASDMTDEEISSLVKEHEVLREKYQKVKRYFFEQQTQVHQLQNTLANQRLSVSRTSWDDSEYGTRFNRLDGLIAQLSFSIRKDWKTIPQYLHTAVNKTAVETGKQEMTAVGRAFISCWLVENIFEKYFHPDLEPGLSSQLKAIQLNIRRNASPAQSLEDEDALVAKVINWRLATLEGLADLLKANSAASNRAALTEKLNEQLIASLQMHLNDPAPPDLNGGVPMIIELAISVAQHLPLESREVHIEYHYPGAPLHSDFMKMESGIPALTNPIEQQPDEADHASVMSGEETADIVEQEQQAQQAQQPGQGHKDHAKKHSIFSSFASKKPTPTPATMGKLGQGGSQQSLSQPPSSSSGAAKEDAPPPKVRLSVGPSVEIRGKSILVKAPVYST